MQLQEAWLQGIQAWAEGNDSVREVWLFGSRARGDATKDSDVDLAIVLMPPQGDLDWAFGNYCAFGDRWQAGLAAALGRHVSLEAVHPDSPKHEEIKAQGTLLWRRDGN